MVAAQFFVAGNGKYNEVAAGGNRYLGIAGPAKTLVDVRNTVYQQPQRSD